MRRPRAPHSQRISRRGVLTGGAFLAGAGSLRADEVFGARPCVTPSANDYKCTPGEGEGETLYNGIRLPKIWPPTGMVIDSYDPMPVPYLIHPPKVIPIDVGRQLFVDDFLIEKTTAQRKFHRPEKYAGNPLVSPQKEWEQNQGLCPVAAPFSDGVFYDPADKLFKMWYMAGWYDNKTALCTSPDGLHWTRPELDVVPGSNLVLVTPELLRDGVSVWLDHEAADPTERFKLYMFVREGEVGAEFRVGGRTGGYQYTSSDGVHWTLRGKTAATSDNDTFFYNPFRRKWVFTVRKGWLATEAWSNDPSNDPNPPYEGGFRAAQPWSNDPYEGKRRPRTRARSYWEHVDFRAAIGGWAGYDPVFWLGTDRLDEKRREYPIGHEPQLYKVDAVGYESLMIGLLQLHYGPPNKVCAQGGFPKLTELQLAFSRDGFHWDRANRETFIGATLRKDSWERAYIHSVGGVCNVVGDKLYFYYSAFKGDESKVGDNAPYSNSYNGMYSDGSVGLAILRRDGFASIEAGSAEKMLLTRPLIFSGKHLFVNIDAPNGQVAVELCDEAGAPIPGFSRTDCIAVSGDSTRMPVRWHQKPDLSAIARTPVRFKFYVVAAKLYSFWVSKTAEGESGGATAAGGPGFTGTWDV